MLDSATAEARRRGNPVLTLEHAVYAMAGEPPGAALLFSRSPEEAVALTRDVHAHGIGSAGHDSPREARQLVERATALAQDLDYPLRLSIQHAR